MNSSKNETTQPRIRVPRSIPSKMYIEPDFEFRPELIDGDQVTHQSEELNNQFDDFLVEFYTPNDLEMMINECVDRIENDWNTELHKIWNSDDSEELIDDSPDRGRSKRIAHLLTELRSKTIPHGGFSHFMKGPEWKSLDRPEPLTDEDGEYYFRKWENGDLIDREYKWFYEVDEGDQRYVQLQLDLEGSSNE